MLPLLLRLYFQPPSALRRHPQFRAMQWLLHFPRVQSSVHVAPGTGRALAPMVDDETSAASQAPRQIITFP
jgi:hypothetical protein